MKNSPRDTIISKNNNNSQYSSGDLLVDLEVEVSKDSHSNVHS
jgi:hypothetical protein